MPGSSEFVSFIVEKSGFIKEILKISSKLLEKS